MTTRYACSHLAPPHAPFPPTYPSSSSSFSPLTSLYFCEECDAIRCDQCVAVEVASYFCPNCLFDVPGANVRGDKNRCARSCFACPQCSTALSVQATETGGSAEDGSSSAPTPGPPYVLVCPGCKWSSKAVGWTFEKPTGLAMQLQKTFKEPESVQSEFDALKDHLETYISLSTPAAAPRSANRNLPSRHVSSLTQAAARALHRDIPSMAAGSARTRTRSLGTGGTRAAGGEDRKIGWDEMGSYKAKTGCWRELGLERGNQDVELMKGLGVAGADGIAEVDRRWATSWHRDGIAKEMLPKRIPLSTKLTKRCPHPSCRHLLIQPDTKGTRMKIKMVAASYLPEVEVGRRRRRVQSGDSAEVPVADEAGRRKRTRSGKEEDEDMAQPLKAGHVYTFQIAFTNPLYDTIQIRLTAAHVPRTAPPANHALHIPTSHFTVSALKDAWAYDEEEDEVDPLEGSEGTSETPEGSAMGSLGKRSRLSVLATTGATKERKSREGGVEKKGNISKVGLEVEVLPDASGKVEFDLEVRYTYRAEDPLSTPERKAAGERSGGEAFKTFTFWIRVCVGEVF